MIIRINEIEEVAFPHFRGGEGTVYIKRFQDEAGNKAMLTRLEPGSSVGMHTHETNMEVGYVVYGHGKVNFDGEIFELTPGLVHYCPKGHSHSVFNDSDEDLLMYNVVAVQ